MIKKLLINSKTNILNKEDSIIVSDVKLLDIDLKTGFLKQIIRQEESQVIFCESILIAWYYYSCYNHKTEEWCENLIGEWPKQEFRPLKGTRLKLFHELLKQIVFQHCNGKMQVENDIYSHILEVLTKK